MHLRLLSDQRDESDIRACQNFHLSFSTARQVPIYKGKMLQFRIMSLAVLAFTGAAQAMEHMDQAYGPILAQCYSAAKDGSARAACQGRMSGACMENEESGQSTLGMTICLSAEAEAWDALLNAEYSRALAGAKLMDTEEAEYFPEFANRANALREAQRAWITFRDADCELAYAQWGSGSMRNIAFADCRMEMTARRTLELRDMQEMLQ